MPLADERDASGCAEALRPHHWNMDPSIVITPSVFYFGTPVALISTLMPDCHTTNITPISSVWSLGDTYILGFGSEGQAVTNIQRVGELVINFPDASLVSKVEKIAPTTGALVVPTSKRERYRHEPNKWRLGNFTPLPSDLVRPDRIADCPIQIEAKALRLTPIDETGQTLIVHAKILRTHAHASVVKPESSHLDLNRWNPLYYTFRHYYAQGDRVGTNFRAEQ